MYRDSNMPAYAWLGERPLDTEYTEKKMHVLGYPYTAEDMQALAGKNEMDALVAYLMRLGRELKP